MNENRLVKRAVREQWRMGERGNLFLDAPKTLNFDQLCVLANDRKTWKALTRALGNKTQVTGPSRTPVRNTRRSSRAQNTEYNEDKLANKCTDQPTSKPAITLSPRAPSFTPTITPGPAAKGLSEAERRAKLYRAREIHYAFFRPGYVPRKKKKKAVKKQRVMFTDKERRQWARDHWFLHHGQQESPTLTAPTALQKSTVAGTDTPDKLSLPALPTWSVAKAAVFDSSSDDDDTNSGFVVTSSQDSGCRWAAEAPRPDLSNSDPSDNWAAPAYITGDDTTMIDLKSVIDTTTESPLTSFAEFGHVEYPNETLFNSMSPIPRTRDTHPQWTPESNDTHGDQTHT